MEMTYGELRETLAKATRAAEAEIRDLEAARQAEITAINARYDAKVRKVRRDLKNLEED